jgi:hypothetical protein
MSAAARQDCLRWDVLGRAAAEPDIADPVDRRAMREMGRLLQPQRLLREPDIMQRIQVVVAEAAA